MKQGEHTSVVPGARESYTPLWNNQSDVSLARLAGRFGELRGSKVYLLFSGGLDTSFLAHFLRHVIKAEVLAVAVDVGSILGSSSSQIERTQRRAEDLGIDFLRLDGTPYLQELLLSCIRAEGQLFRGHHPASSLSRIAIVRAVLDRAKSERPDVIIHGSTGFQNNAFRFHNAFRAYATLYGLNFRVLAPNLDGSIERVIAQRYLAGAGVSIVGTGSEDVHSVDDNIFGLEAEDASLHDPETMFDVEANLIPADAASRSASVAARVNLKFAEGIPTELSVDGRRAECRTPVDILNKLNAVGLNFRIGIHDYYEPRPTGRYAREVHVAPGMTILVKARHLLRTCMLNPIQNRELERLSTLWSEFVMTANLWTHQLRKRADSLFAEYSSSLSGAVSFRLADRCIDMPTVRPSSVSFSGARAATEELIESLYSYLCASQDNRALLSVNSEIRTIADAMDRTIEATYRHCV